MTVDESTKKYTIFSKETLIPIGSIVVIIAAVVWITNLAADVRRNRDDLLTFSVELKKHEDEGTASSKDEGQRLVRIETKVDLLAGSVAQIQKQVTK